MQCAGSCGYVYPAGLTLGRTGDQMMQFAGYYLFAKDTNRKLVVPLELHHQIGFSHLHGFDLVQGMWDKPLKRSDFGPPIRMLYQNGFIKTGDLSCGNNVTLAPQHIGSDKQEEYTPTHYFTLHKHREAKNVTEALTKFYHFKPEILKQCRLAIEEALVKAHCFDCKCATIVGHIRRTDMLRIYSPTNTNRNISAYYVHQAYHYLNKKLLQSFDCTVLFLVSDDYSWTLEHAPVAQFMHIFNKSVDPLVDLCIIASADAVITTVGNYGYIGAYLSSGLVTFQSNMFIPKPLSTWTSIDPCPPNVTQKEFEERTECWPQH